MKYLAVIITVIIIFASGWMAGTYFTDAEIREVKVVEYVPIMKVDPEKLSFQDLVGHVKNPIIIEHRIDDNVMKIKAYDKAKESKKDIKLEAVISSDWSMRITIGAVALALGLGFGVLR